jgi:RNA-directed DNA polymerase
MNYKRKRTYLRFKSVKFLANYLDHSKEFLIDIPKHQQDFYIYMPNRPVPGKPGKKRTYYNPTKPYKKLLKLIDKRVLSRVALPKTFQGGIKGYSPTTNAEKHVGKHELVKIDIQDFFPSITPEQVCKAFLSLQMKKDCTVLLTSLTTVYNTKPQLPQGFPTSPKIAALVLKGIEKRIHQLAKEFNWEVTFWIDDIAISGNFPVTKFKKLISQILKDEGFVAHPGKTEGFKQGDKKQRIVTGAVVNKKLNIPKEKRKWIEDSLYYAKKFGIPNHLKRAGIEPSIVNIEKFKQTLFGRINHATTVNKDLGEKYIKQFNELSSS